MVGRAKVTAMFGVATTPQRTTVAVLLRDHAGHTADGEAIAVLDGARLPTRAAIAGFTHAAGSCSTGWRGADRDTAGRRRRLPARGAAAHRSLAAFSTKVMTSSGFQGLGMNCAFLGSR